MISRRSVLGLLTAGAALPLVASCGGGHHDRAAAATAGAGAASPLPGGGTGPATLMIIRHAEKPEDGGPAGVTAGGTVDPESLTVTGWTRAGALTELFAPAVGTLRPGLLRPAAVLASQPEDGGSRRPIETVTPVAARLGVPVTATYRKDDHAGVAATLAASAGATLVAWQHEDIPGIVAALGRVSPTPPSSWPSDRFDLVWVLTADGQGGWTFSQVPQLLLAGDGAGPAT